MLRFCPECGTEAVTARFCPECGADLAALREALQKEHERRPADASGDRRGTERPERRRESPARRARAGVPADGSPGPGIPRWILFGGALAAAAAIVAVVLAAMLGAPGAAGGQGGAAQPSPTASVADTSGTYEQLVQRGNDLYDQGSELFAAGSMDEAAAHFAAAAEVYAAAWDKQPGDPNLGTDLATAFFYSGDLAEALARIDAVLAEHPRFQAALFNKGNFLQHAARMATQAGEGEEAAGLRVQARAAYEEAAAVDPDSEMGKRAAAAAEGL